MRWGKKRKPLFRHLKCSVTSDLPSEIAFKPSAFSLTRDVVRPCTLRPIVTCVHAVNAQCLAVSQGKKFEIGWVLSYYPSFYSMYYLWTNNTLEYMHASDTIEFRLCVCASLHVWWVQASSKLTYWDRFCVTLAFAMDWTSLPVSAHIPTYSNHIDCAVSSKSTNQDWVAHAWTLSLQGPGSKLRRSKYWSSQRHSRSVCEVFWGWTLRVSLPSLPALLCHGTSWLKLTKDASSTEKLSGLLNTFIELGHHGLENLTFWGFKTQARWVSV